MSRGVKSDERREALQRWTVRAATAVASRSVTVPLHTVPSAPPATPAQVSRTSISTSFVDALRNTRLSGSGQPLDVIEAHGDTPKARVGTTAADIFKRLWSRCSRTWDSGHSRASAGVGLGNPLEKAQTGGWAVRMDSSEKKLNLVGGVVGAKPIGLFADASVR
jgi:hypothetical protein